MTCRRFSDRVLRRRESADRRPRTGLPELLRHGRYAVRRTWAVSPRLFTSLVGIDGVRAVLPVAGALLVGLLVQQAQLVIDGSELRETLLIPALAAVVVLMLLGTFTQLARQYVIARLNDELRLHVTSDILRHVAQLDLAYFEDRDSQDITERATRQPGRDLLDFVLEAVTVAAQSVQAITLLGVLMFVEPVFTPLLLVSSVPWLLFRWHMAGVTYTAQREQSTLRRWAAYYSAVLTNRMMVPTIKFFRLAPVLVGQYSEQMRRVMSVNTGLYRKQAIGSALGASLLVVGSMALVTWVGKRTVDGVLTIQLLTTFAVAVTRLPASISTLVEALSGCLERTLFISNLVELLEQEPGIRDGAATPALHGDVRLSDVRFTYPGAQRETICGVDMVIAAGTTVALVGPNGCGKTTLTKLLSRLYDVNSGRVTIDGHDVRELSVAHLHENIACVTQQPTRFECTAADYIALGDWERLSGDRAAIEELAARAHVRELVEAMPQGFDTLLGRRFGTYDPSAGQWQRLAIARALANPAPLLILDEPTASMDMQAESEMYEGFKRLAAGRTALLISHRFSTVAMADLIYVMDCGRIVASGTHAELIEQDGMYARFFDLHRRMMDGAS